MHADKRAVSLAARALPARMRDQAAGATRGSQEFASRLRGRARKECASDWGACKDDLRGEAAYRRGFQSSPFRELKSMKVYWNHMHATAKVSILVSEHMDLGKLDVIEHRVQARQIHELEQELAKRGVAWDRNWDILGSEHLCIDSAIVHVDTHFRAGKARLGVLRLLSVNCAAHMDAKAEERAAIAVARCVFSILAMTSLVIWTGPA